jgi:hypothetical protein
MGPDYNIPAFRTDKTAQKMLIPLHMTAAARRVPSRLAASVIALAILTFSIADVGAVPAAPVMNLPRAMGSSILLSWSSVAGATSYRLGVGLLPGSELVSYDVGSLTQLVFTSPFSGGGWVHVYAIDATGASPRSNSVSLGVGTPTAPSAPTNLQALVTGNHVTLTWTPGAGGGAPATFEVEAGLNPGAATLGAFPVGLTSQAAVPNVPNGIYFVRLYARNTAGRSPASNEVRVDVPGGCAAPDMAAVTSTVSGTTVTIAWTPTAGASSFRLTASATPGGPPLAVQNYPLTQTSATFAGVPVGTYYVKVAALASCGSQSVSPEATVIVSAPAPSGFRTPNPAPGQILPLPNRADVVNAVAASHRSDLSNSCVDSGGTNNWLFRLVSELRKTDTRWGLNWKRARVGDMSQDVVTYNYSSEPDEGTYNVYVVDVIGGHCGGNPQPAWIDVTILGTTGARWTLQPYTQAGWPATADRPE